MKKHTTIILSLCIILLLAACNIAPLEDIEPQDISTPPEVPQPPEEPAYLLPANDPEEPTATRYPLNVAMVSTSAGHTLAVMQNGELWAWGENSQWSSFLGDGTTETRLSPVWIMDNVVSAVAGETHSLAITANGELWAWGRNGTGQIGDGTRTIRESEAEWLGVSAMDNDRLSPVKIMGDVIHAAIAPTFSNAQVGYSARSYAITSDRVLWAWGGAIDAMHGYLGDGTDEARLEPTRIMENVASFVPSYHGGFVITDCGTLWGWGENYNGMFDDTAVFPEPWHEELGIGVQLSPVPIMEDVLEVTVYHRGSVLAVTTDGTLWRLGDPHVRLMENVATARGAYPYAIFALTTNGDLYAWGERHDVEADLWRTNPRIPLLGDGTTDDRETPVRIMENVDSFVIEARAAFAVTNDRTLWAWGDNHPGWIGDGTGWVTKPIEGTGLYEWIGEPRLSPVPILENVRQISSRFADDHGSTRAISTFAVTTDGELWAWGGCQRGFSILGDGTREHRLFPILIIEGQRP